MAEFPQIIPMGEKSILMNFQPSVDEKLLEKLLGLKEFLTNKLIKEEVEVINTYSSLLINYRDSIKDLYGEVLRLKQLVREANIQNKVEKRIFHIPVCYDEEFALDINIVSNQNNLSKKEIIRLHSAPVYTVYFIGFLPGFLYLGGLDKRLQISRKEQPRLNVQKGAVGIGENQTGIYPKTSPGGWQIIGNSPVPLFDKNEVPPTTISAGDKLKFFPVTREEYFEIAQEVENNTFSLKIEDYDS